MKSEQQTGARVKPAAVVAWKGKNKQDKEMIEMSKYMVRDCETGHTTTIDIQNRTKEAVGLDITIKSRDSNQIAHEWIGIKKIDIFQAMLGTPEPDEPEQSG